MTTLAHHLDRPASGLTGAIEDTALATFWMSESRLAAERQVGWQRAVDRLLKLRSALVKDQTEPPADLAAMDSAIDFALDFSASSPPPNQVGINVDGGVSFEWLAGPQTTLVDVNQKGLAEVTVMANGRISSSSVLCRNPTSRRAEVTS